MKATEPGSAGTSETTTREHLPTPSEPPSSEAEHSTAAPGAALHSASPAPSARSLRVMAWVRWLLLAAVTALAGYSVWTFWGPARSTPLASEAPPTVYHCPMHPQIRSSQPGECPICHMTLTPIEPERGATDGATEHSSETAPSPAGLTPISIDAEKQRGIGLATSVVSSAALGDQLRVPGVLSAPETGLSQVRVRAAGFVERVAVSQTGVRVRRGQTLAWIYSPEIYRAQEEFLAATRWTAPGASAARGGAAPAELVAASRRGLELLGLSGADIDEVARSGKALRAVPVRAPSSGYVTRFGAVLGSRAEPETVLYELADLSKVWIIASVYERDLPAIQQGMEASFSLNGSTDAATTAKVDLIEPQLDEVTRTGKVRLVLANRDGSLRPGLFGEVTFALPASQGVFVPRDAVIRTGEHDYVYVAVGSERFEPRSVRTGLSVGDRVQVLSGVAAGDRVVTRGSFMLDSESRLQASLSEPSSAAALPSAAAPSEAAPGAPPRGSPAAAPPASRAPGAGGDLGCDTAFDQRRFPDKYRECRACERQHAGMGTMVDDCKKTIAPPWR